MTKRIVSFISFIFIVLYAVPIAFSEVDHEIETIDEETFESLWMKFFMAAFDLYDLNTGRDTYPSVVFGYDSNGVPYADGKCYYYINYGDRDLSGCYASALEKFKECLTPELAERMVENFHVPGGPDVELIRRGSDGNWYRLFLVRPGGAHASSVHSIRIDGNNARVESQIEVDVIDLEESGRTVYPYDKHIIEDWTVDLVYTEDGWRISGGDVFDFILNYAATSPETGDSDGTRAAILAVTAAVAAVLHAVILTVSRRRRRAV